MAGYIPNSSGGNDNNNILHALFQSASQRQDQQSVTGSQGAGPSFQAAPGYNQSVRHELQSMVDPRSNASSRGASPISRQQPAMFRSNTGTPPSQMAPTNVPKDDQKTNLLYLLQPQRPPPQDPRGDGTFNQGAYGQGRAQMDQRSVSMAGSDNHKANASMSRSFSQQKTVSHATPGSLLALLNQPKSSVQQSQVPYENSTRAQHDKNGKNPEAIPQSDFATDGTNYLQELLGNKPKELPKQDKSFEKLVEKSADELTDELANMLRSPPVNASIGNGATEPIKSSEHATVIDAEQHADSADAMAVRTNNTVAVDTPEIANVIDGIDNLSVDASKSGPEKAASSDNTRAESVADDWETALDKAGDATEDQDNTKSLVDVYDFNPLQPFLSITINPEFDMPRATFPTDEEATMAIARLKKPFDQNDRTLVTATKSHIIFAMSKNGGVRVVRQDNGQNKMVFEETQDQIFNVAACIDKDNACETVVATGCSGTVYWFMAKDARGESVEDITPHHSFALPPIQSPGDENPGGVLKTRARKSSNHTQFFGVGRGKSIHVIFPNLITKGDFYKPGTARTVDVEKYLAYRTLKIDTGKAAKDFTFSQDDTTVVSLDKAGRIKFWDIRGLVSDDTETHSVELTEPLLTLVTTPANEKSWPTSIIFIDKWRRVVKNSALRYLLVGMKQNHTLQLWDLALRRIVQEIHLPHDKDSDAACSVVYHGVDSVIVVGHPTRNSVYFIHVTLPRFTTPKTMSQADFMEQVGNGSFPTPGSSAAFSSIREYRFSEGTKPETGSDKRVRGDLRSLDILQDPATTHDPLILFELYTMHSTGVTSIAIRPETLGWNAKKQETKTISASKAGLATIAKLPSIDQALLQKESPTSPSLTTSPSVPSTPQVKEILRKPASVSTPTESATLPSPLPVKRVDSVPKAIPGNGGPDAVPVAEKSEKRKKRKSSSSSRATDASVDAVASSSRPLESIPEASSEAKASKNADFDLEATLGAIFFNFEQGWDRVMDAFNHQRDTAARTQVKMLELVSETLTNNVDKALSAMVETQFKTTIAPVLTATIQQVIEKNLPQHLKIVLNGVVQNSVAKEVQSALSGALTKALSSPQFTKQMSQMMSQLGLAREVTQQSTNETLRNVANRVSEVQKQQAADAERIDALLKQRESDAEALQIMAKQRLSDSEKIDKLEVVVRQLGELISSMASAEENSRQSALVREDKLATIIEHIQAQAANRATTPSRDSPHVPSSALSSHAHSQTQESVQNQREPEQPFDDEKCTGIIDLINQAVAESDRFRDMNNKDEAIKKWEFILHNWLSCGDDQMTQIIFDYCLCHQNPDFMYDLDDPIYLYITMRALASNLGTSSFLPRLDWLQTSMKAAGAFNYGNMNPSLTENFPEVIRYVRQSLTDALSAQERLVGDVDYSNLVTVLRKLIEMTTRLIDKVQN